MYTFAITTYLTALSQATTAAAAATTTTTTTTYDDNHRLAFNQSASQLSSLPKECYPKVVGSEEQQQQLYVNLSTFWYCFLALITTIGLLISLISNMIIIYLFTSTPFLRKNPSNIIAVNLSLSDLLYCVQWPSVIYCSLTQSTWILDHSFVCQSFGFITVGTALASILTVLAMSIERAIVILYSIHARNKFTIRLAWMIIVLIWIVSLSSSLPPLFGKFNRYTLDPSKTSCTLDYLSRQTNYRLYIMILFVGYWIVPTILITISYITIIVTFKKSSLDLKKISGETCASSTNCFVIRGPYYFGRKLRDSLRLRGFASNQEHSKDKGTSESVCERRASASVVDLSSHFSLNSGDKGGESEIISSIKTNYDKRKTFKRVVSSSALPSQLVANQQRAENNNNSCRSYRDTEIGNRFKETVNSIKHSRSDIDRWRSNLGHKSRANPATNAAISFRPRIIKTLSNIKALPQQAAANSQLTRTVLQFRLAKMSFYLILLWLVSWTPIASLAMINSVMKCPKASATAVFLASTMSKLGPALDVFIYGISHPKIKSRFKQIIRRLLFLNYLGSHNIELSSN